MQGNNLSSKERRELDRLRVKGTGCVLYRKRHPSAAAAAAVKQAAVDAEKARQKQEDQERQEEAERKERKAKEEEQKKMKAMEVSNTREAEAAAADLFTAAANNLPEGMEREGVVVSGECVVSENGRGSQSSAAGGMDGGGDSSGGGTADQLPAVEDLAFLAEDFLAQVNLFCLSKFKSFLICMHYI